MGYLNLSTVQCIKKISRALHTKACKKVLLKYIPCPWHKLNTSISDQYVCPSSTPSCSSRYAQSMSTSYKQEWVSLLVIKMLFLLKINLQEWSKRSLGNVQLNIPTLYHVKCMETQGEFTCGLTLHGDPPGHQVWSRDHGGEHWIDDKAVHKKEKVCYRRHRKLTQFGILILEISTWFLVNLSTQIILESWWELRHWLPMGNFSLAVEEVYIEQYLPKHAWSDYSFS